MSWMQNGMVNSVSRNLFSIEAYIFLHCNLMPEMFCCWILFLKNNLLKNTIIQQVIFNPLLFNSGSNSVVIKFIKFINIHVVQHATL